MFLAVERVQLAGRRRVRKHHVCSKSWQHLRSHERIQDRHGLVICGVAFERQDYSRRQHRTQENAAYRRRNAWPITRQRAMVFTHMNIFPRLFRFSPQPSLQPSESCHPPSTIVTPKTGNRGLPTPPAGRNAKDGEVHPWPSSQYPSFAPEPSL